MSTFIFTLYEVFSFRMATRLLDTNNPHCILNQKARSIASIQNFLVVYTIYI